MIIFNITKVGKAERGKETASPNGIVGILQALDTSVENNGSSRLNSSNYYTLRIQAIILVHHLSTFQKACHP